MSQEANRRLARRLLEDFWGKGDLSLADELFTPDFLHHRVPPGTPRGPEGQRQFVTMIRDRFPDFTSTIDDLIVEGDRVAARWTGNYSEGVDVLRIENGKIAELWSYIQMVKRESAEG